MKYLFGIFVATLLATHLLSAKDDLTLKLEALAELIKEVQVKDDYYRQSLSWSPEKPFRVNLEVTEVDKNGKTKKMGYQFNLGLLDPNLIRWEDGKDKIQVILRSGQSSVVKALENDAFKGFEKEAVILADGIDNARALQDLLREIIPMASEQWKKSAVMPTTFEAFKSWMAKKVMMAKIGEETVTQKWEAHPEHPCRFSLQQAVDGKGDNFLFEWNMADINISTIDVGIKKKEVFIQMKTVDNEKFLRLEKNGSIKNYQNELFLYTSEVDDAQMLSQALRELARFATEEQQNYLPTYSSKQEALKDLRTLLTSFKSGDNDINQQIEGDCLLSYQLLVNDGKKTEALQYDFYLGDLQLGQMEIVVKGTDVFVEASIRNKEKLIAVMENGEQANYDDKLIFLVADIPTAKAVKNCLNYLADTCPREFPAKDWTWLKQAVETGPQRLEGVSQQISLMENDPCKWRLTIKEVSSKKSQEETFEFNLYDLNDRSVELEVKGKDVFINVTTKNKDEIIKHFTDNNEKLGYENELFFVIQDIQTAKTVITTLSELMEGCEQ